MSDDDDDYDGDYGDGDDYDDHHQVAALFHRILLLSGS